MNRTIADSINPAVLTALIGGQKPNGYRPQRRKRGVCDTLTILHIRDAFRARGVKIMPKTAISLLALIMDGKKVEWRGIKIHADKRCNNLYAYRI